MSLEALKAPPLELDAELEKKLTEKVDLVISVSVSRAEFAEWKLFDT